MVGYTENSKVILGDADKIFEITNDVEHWTDLFTEYKSVKVLEKKENTITFELTTIEGKSWKSIRTFNKQEMQVEAHRLVEKPPFKYMNIKWIYEVLPNNCGVNLTWIQEFEITDDCPHDIYDMESYLNRTTRKQMQAVKNNVEKRLKNE